LPRASQTLAPSLIERERKGLLERVLCTMFDNSYRMQRFTINVYGMDGKACIIRIRNTNKLSDIYFIESCNDEKKVMNYDECEKFKSLIISKMYQIIIQVHVFNYTHKNINIVCSI
jgi:hypothetical protein